jgi:hypothetical protein
LEQAQAHRAKSRQSRVPAWGMSQGKAPLLG